MQPVLELILARHGVDLVELRLHLGLLKGAPDRVQHPSALAPGEVRIEGLLASELRDDDLFRQRLVVLQRMLSALDQHPSRGRQGGPQGPAQRAHVGAAGEHDPQRPGGGEVLLGARRLTFNLHRHEPLVHRVRRLPRLLLLGALAAARQPEVRYARRYSVSSPHGVLCPLKHHVPPSGDLCRCGTGNVIRLGLLFRILRQLCLRLLRHLLEDRGHAQQLHGLGLPRLGVRLHGGRHAVDLALAEILLCFLF
mmetsp:Transcript_50391/g.146221  ORF Transcript_50391/g.146221 Transcript_50391/m.146221 type:complete len:252 (-) Transcript_50391:1694-2449(-)